MHINDIIKRMKYLKKFTLRLCLLSISASVLLSACSSEEASQSGKAKTKKQLNTDKNTSTKSKEQLPVKVTDTTFTRLSRTELQISWSDSLNPYVAKYDVLRKCPEQSEWTVIQTLHSDGETLGRTLAVTDTLSNDSMQQYLYRVDVTVVSPDKYKSESGKEIPATNLILCIDAGHFKGKNAITSDTLGYAEGDFTLALAIELEKTLKETYGISSKLTRSSGTITIDGYEDQQLDSSHISLRGEMAKDCDLFISLHTNANLENAGGSPTEQQPISINKPIILVNSVALDNPTALRIANEVGCRLAAASFDKGLSETKAFRETQKQDVLEWTDTYNDGRHKEGTVCKRTGTKGDYYGVLRGASNVNVSGLIIEHGFHTVPEVRQAAVKGDLKAVWSKADAEGIAAGFGLVKNN